MSIQSWESCIVPPLLTLQHSGKFPNTVENSRNTHEEIVEMTKERNKEMESLHLFFKN